MNYFLLTMLFVLTIIGLKIGRNNLLSPTFVMPLSLAISSFIVTVNTNYWNYVVSFDTALIIIFSIITFFIGHILSRVFIFKLKKVSQTVSIEESHLQEPGRFMLLAFLAYCSIVFLYVFWTQYKGAAAIGMGQMLSSIIEANRYYIEKDSKFLFKLLLITSKVICEYVIVIYYINKILYKKSINGLITLMIVIMNLLSFIMTTNRTDIISLSVFLIFTIFYFEYVFHNWRSSCIGAKKIIKSIFVIFICLIMFRLLGYLTGKSELYSFYDNLCIYIGSSIVCFDKVVCDNYITFPFGYTPQLFSGVYSFLSILGVDTVTDNLVWPHQYWDNGASNLYTGLFIYYFNYGILGLLGVEMVLGYIYGVLWKRVSTNQVSLGGVIVYGSIFFYYLSMTSIYERFFTHFFTITTIIEIFFIWILIDRNRILRICLFQNKKGL